MKRTLLQFVLIFFLIFFTTFNPVNNSNLNDFVFPLKYIKIENNRVVENDDLYKKLSFLIGKNLLSINSLDVEKVLKKYEFISGVNIKKIYPHTLKLIINEKTPIAILTNKNKSFYISDAGDFLNFKKIDYFKNLPMVFGKGDNFISFYESLTKVNFPINTIKSYYYFELGRWDIILTDERLIKLPITNYEESLINFIKINSNKELKNYKLFDYRINSQLILK